MPTQKGFDVWIAGLSGNQRHRRQWESRFNLARKWAAQFYHQPYGRRLRRCANRKWERKKKHEENSGESEETPFDHLSPLSLVQNGKRLVPDYNKRGYIYKIANLAGDLHF